ncbi:MAG: RNA methyltransferase substrate-binding domain-containing protein, partial [Bacteroidota bacterium]
MQQKSDNLIYGIRPVIESMKAGKDFDKVFIQKGLKGEHFVELYALMKDLEIPYQHVP